jgi:branched-chain amino acid transport system ATP-binding protein
LTPLLEVRNLEVFYGRLQALHGVSIDVEEGTIATVLGANGAGKSTLLRAISGIVAARSGTVNFAGRPIHNRPPDAILRAGIAHVPEGRELFSGLTVAENLLLGGYVRSRSEIEHSQRFVLETFPILHERKALRAGMLSGGEQQMLAIGRALMSEPRLIILDEPSVGLAPSIRDEVFEIILRLNRSRRLTVLMVEQEVQAALSMSDRCYVLQTGSVVADGTAAELSARKDIADFYLGGLQM